MFAIITSHLRRDFTRLVFNEKGQWQRLPRRTKLQPFIGFIADSQNHNMCNSIPPSHQIESLKFIGALV